MIQKMRIRFVILSMSALLAVLLGILGAINIANYSGIVSEADRILSILSDNQGFFPRENDPNTKPGKSPFDRKLSPDARYDSRFFSVVLSENGSVTQTDIRAGTAMDAEAAAALAGQVLSQENSTGFIQSYRFLLRQDESVTRVLFLDCGREIESFQRFLLTSIFLALVGLLLVFTLVVYFSGRIVRPLAQSYEKQKQFITDAGHEMKTPMTILQADADILEMELGENEWLTDIRNQIRHLSALTNDLVSLARLEEEKALHILEIPISDVILEAAESFRSPAQAQGKTLSLSVESMLSMKADEKAIRQLVGILLDNALKYSPEGSCICLSFFRQARQLKLTVSNTASVPLPKGNPDILFERFYRTDSSRNSQTGGHGIGLSIAMAIVTAHGGKIHASVQEDTALQIAAVFPQAY